MEKRVYGYGSLLWLIVMEGNVGYSVWEGDPVFVESWVGSWVRREGLVRVGGWVRGEGLVRVQRETAQQIKPEAARAIQSAE